jgi:hypothetical protein
VTIPAGDIGDCYMIRVAGFADDDGTQWQNQELRVTCGGVVALESPTAGDDDCVGGANAGNACTVNADCPGGVCGNKSRYLSVTPSNAAVAGGTPTSIKVTILSARECAGGVNVGRGCETSSQCPASSCVNSTKIGQVWWAGPEGNIPNSPQAVLRGAQLQCSDTPANSQVWTTGVLHLFGQPVVPFAQYGVAHCDENGDNCSPNLLVSTGEWGDCTAPFGGVSQPAFGDINEIVFKFRNLGTSLPMARVDLVGTGNPGQPNTSAPGGQTANFADIGACVEGFRGIGYAYTIPACTP